MLFLCDTMLSFPFGLAPPGFVNVARGKLQSRGDDAQLVEAERGGVLWMTDDVDLGWVGEPCKRGNDTAEDEVVAVGDGGYTVRSRWI